MNVKIPYPAKMSEADIQAILWQSLIKEGMDARLEITNKVGRKYRLDIVVFKNREAICIIECKNWSVRYIRTRKYQEAKNTKQIKKYKELFGLPVLICGCMAAINPVTKIAKSLYFNTPYPQF